MLKLMRYIYIFWHKENVRLPLGGKEQIRALSMAVELDNKLFVLIVRFPSSLRQRSNRLYASSTDHQQVVFIVLSALVITDSSYTRTWI